MRWMGITMFLLFSVAAHAAELCGDADGSGSVTVSDGVQALRAAADLSSTCTTARCDVDDGGSVTVSDGVNVLRAAAGLTVDLRCPNTGPSCTTATITVSLDVPEPIGAATLTLAYPNVVFLPGSGDAAAARVTLLASGLFGNGEPDDRDDRVTVRLVALDGLADGPLLAVRFDCGGATPAASAFDCVLSDVFAVDGATRVEGARCTVEVASE